MYQINKNQWQGIQFTIQNVSIKSDMKDEISNLKVNLQYKMFLLNFEKEIYKGGQIIFTIQNVSIKW